MIDSQFDRLSPELQRAARWIARHGRALALHSMRESARAAGVTPATMTRLARRLEFASFEELRAPFRRQLAGTDSGAEFERMLHRRRRAGRAPDGLLGSLNALQQANVASAARLNGPAAIEAAARALVEARRVWFLGLRAAHGIAFYLAYAYALLRPNGRLVHGLGGTLDDQIAQIGAGDALVALSQSPYTRQTVDAVALAHANGATLVALTDSALSPLAREAEHALLYDTASNAYFHSFTGAQALAESLTAAVAACGGAGAAEHLRRMREHLHEGGAYWERPGDRE